MSYFETLSTALSTACSKRGPPPAQLYTARIALKDDLLRDLLDRSVHSLQQGSTKLVGILGRLVLAERSVSRSTTTGEGGEHEVEIRPLTSKICVPSTMNTRVPPMAAAEYVL